MVGKVRCAVLVIAYCAVQCLARHLTASNHALSAFWCAITVTFFGTYSKAPLRVQRTVQAAKDNIFELRCSQTWIILATLAVDTT